MTLHRGHVGTPSSSERLRLWVMGSGLRSKMALGSETLIVMSVLMLGILLRTVDLTDPPLDFQAWRQLRSASIARGIYYEMNPDASPDLRDRAMELGTYEALEPPLFESLVAVTYTFLGQERLWIARAYAILFWTTGGAALYLVVRRVVAARGALISLLYYLFLPFSVVVSRSFLPDVPMVCLTLCALALLLQWISRRTWVWATAAGVVAGLAITTKVFSVFPLGLAMVFLVVSDRGFLKGLRSGQAWWLAALMSAIPATYYVCLRTGAAGDYLHDWVLPFSHMLIDPRFYVRWSAAVHRTATLYAALLGLLGVALSRGRARTLLVSLWAGYILFGAAVPSLIISHTYYQAILVPIVAISLAPLAECVLDRAARWPGWLRSAATASAMLVLVACSWAVARGLLAQDFRPEILGWIKMGSEIPAGEPMIGLTHDYNTRLRYYGWREVAQWPHATDLEMNVLAGGNYDPTDPEIAKVFRERTAGYSYFIVTLFGELDKQPVVKRVLQDNYPATTGEGYILYDLRSSR